MAKDKRIFGVLIVFFILLAMVAGAYWVNRAADALAMQNEQNSATCVIIDAGHGGVDGGAVSCTGVYESQINLQIALRLNDLMQLLGYQTKMIRTDDISVYTEGNTIAAKKVSDLKERVRIINSTKNAILISIHQNYFQDDRYKGAQVFYNRSGEELAKAMQSNFTNTINPGSKRKAKKADGIYLMKNTNCNGVLVECGFLSNPEEEYCLRNAQYQKNLCCVIAASVSSYIKLKAVA